MPVLAEHGAAVPQFTGCCRNCHAQHMGCAMGTMAAIGYVFRIRRYWVFTVSKRTSSAVIPWIAATREVRYTAPPDEKTAGWPMASGPRRLPQRVTCFLVPFLDSFLFFILITPLSVWLVWNRDCFCFSVLPIAYLHKNAPDFLQQSPYALYGGVVMVGDILEVVTAGPHPYDVHLLLGDAFGQVV